MGMPKAVRDQMKKESRGTVAPSPKGNISQTDGRWDPDEKDVALAGRLAKELENPGSLGDTYAADQVREATKRVYALFTESPTKRFLPNRFPMWVEMQERMKSHQFPKVWSSTDPLFIGSLRWAERILAGKLGEAKDLETKYRWDLNLINARKEVFLDDRKNGIIYSRVNGSDDVFVGFAIKDEDEFTAKKKAFNEWWSEFVIKNGNYILEWTWYNNFDKGVTYVNYRLVKSVEHREDEVPDAKPATAPATTAPAADDTRDGTVCRITSRLGTDAENEKAEREIREWAAKRGYRITSKVRDGENRQVVFTMAGKPGRRNAPSLEEIVYGGKGWKKEGGGAWNSLMTLAWWAAVIYVVGYIGWKAYGRYLAAQ